MGRKIKLSVKKRVKLESKGDKTENRVLVSPPATYPGVLSCTQSTVIHSIKGTCNMPCSDLASGRDPEQISENSAFTLSTTSVWLHEMFVSESSNTEVS